jgi:hypothetical protein
MWSRYERDKRPLYSITKIFHKEFSCTAGTSNFYE